MALTNASGNYLKVEDVKTASNIVRFSLYKDANVRNNPSEFDQILPGSIHCGTLPTKMAEVVATGNLLDDLKTAAYEALKQEPPYNGASGETWTDC